MSNINPKSAQSDDEPSAPRSRIVVASMVGTTIEFYDFYIYATAAVSVFPLLFFQKSDSGGGPAGIHGDLRGRLCGPSGRLYSFRALRRPDRTEGHPGRVAPHHGDRNVPHRPPAHRHADRRSGSRTADSPPVLPGAGAGGRVVGGGPVGYRNRQGRETRLGRNVAPSSAPPSASFWPTALSCCLRSCLTTTRPRHS